MNLSEAELRKRLKPILDHHPYIDIEVDAEGFRTVIGNLHPNLLGNFAGGDMAYIANAAAGLVCVVVGRVSETASISVECIDRGDGEKLLARAQIIKLGRKLIRLRVDVHVRKDQSEKLVAIAQINMAPISDPEVQKLVNN